MARPRFAFGLATHVRGAVRIGGFEGRVERWADGEGRVRENLALGALDLVNAYGSSDGWMRTPSGQIESVEPATLEGARRLAAIVFAGDLSTRHECSLLPDEERDGSSWKVVRD